MYNKENNLITLLPTYNSTISPLPISSLFALSCLLFFLVDQTRYSVVSLVYPGFGFGSVRFLVSLWLCLFFLSFGFPFCFSSYVVFCLFVFFDVGVMGVGLGSAWCCDFRYFLPCCVQIKGKSMWSFVLSRRSVASDCHLYSRVSFFTWFKHFNIVQKHDSRSICPCPILVWEISPSGRSKKT